MTELQIDRRALLAGAGVALAAGSAARAAPADEGVRVPLVVRRGQPLVAVELNGKGPFTFLIDTGAGGSGLTADAARRAGLPQAARTNISGVAGGIVQVQTWFAKDVLVGGALQLGLMRFDDYPGAGVDGYLSGNAFLAQPARFALADGEVRLYLKGRPDVSGYAKLPARFEVRRNSALTATRDSLDPHLIVSARLDGRPVRLAIDTGAQPALALLPDASGALWDKTPALNEMIAGATGLAQGRLVRTGPLELGVVSVPQVVASLTDPSAAHVDAAVDGLIGVDLLRQLDLVVDAADATVWLRKGAAFGQAFRYNRSGLTLLGAAGGLAVAGVAAGSPAQAAGLARGDVLTPAQPMSRDAFRWSLTDAPGVAVDMDATRDGKARPIRLVLKELI